MPSPSATSAVVNASASPAGSVLARPAAPLSVCCSSDLDQHTVDDAPRLASPSRPRSVQPVLLDAHEHDLERQRGMRGERRQRHELVEQREVAAVHGRAPAAPHDAVAVDPHDRAVDRDRMHDDAPCGARGAPSASGGGSRSCRSGTRPARRAGRGRRRSPRGSPRARRPAARRAPSATRAASSRAACRWSPRRPFSRVRPGDRLPSLQTW